MGQPQLVHANGVEFLVEVAGRGGVQPVRFDKSISFDGVRDTLEAIASSLTDAWAQVKPSEASVEFGLELTAKQEKLTGMIVEGGGVASLKVTLKWNGSAAAPVVKDSAEVAA